MPQIINGATLSHSALTFYRLLRSVLVLFLDTFLLCRSHVTLPPVDEYYAIKLCSCCCSRSYSCSRLLGTRLFFRCGHSFSSGAFLPTRFLPALILPRLLFLLN